MKNFFKKGISFALTLALAVTMCFGSVGTAKVHAAENVALSVYDGDTLVKEFSLDELKAIAKAEGDKQYKFSGYNRNPSFYTFGAPDNPETPSRGDAQDCYGPTVAGILDEAGVTYTEDQLITFLAPDKVKESFTAEDLFADRYYFPHGAAGTAGGASASAEAYTDAELVFPVIDLSRSDEQESVLRYGQKAPNEQNVSAFVKYVADGGSIIIGDTLTESWPEISAANYNGGEVLPETEITFDIPASMLGKKVAAYYTTDGTEPGPGDAIYNYNKYGDVHKIILPDKESTVTYKFKVVGYGKLDSKVTTFTYTVMDPDSPAKPAAFSADMYNSNSVQLSWGKVEDADGYEIMKLNAETGEYETAASILNNAMVSYVDKDLMIGSSNSYIVRAFILLSSGQRVYGSATAERTVIVPDLTAPELNSAERTGYGSIQIKWTAAAGVTGYEIHRYDAVTGKYEPAATIEDNNVISYKDAGLKTGRTYSYKIRAYLVQSDGTKSYSAFSNVKSAAPALAKPSLNSAAKTGYAVIQVKWSKVAGANGYQIWRYDAVSKKYKHVKTITSGSTVSWKNTGLKTGRKYTYKVRAYRTVDGEKICSAYSGTRYATPSLSKPVMRTLKAGSRSIIVRWNKVAGANGYKIYRSTSKNGKYTCVKTIKTGGTLSWKNTKLKKGKRYYYKVKAYRIVDKKNVYSSISSVKYIKSK